MAEVVAIKPTLSDSTFKTRPNFKAYIQTDGNAGLDAIQAFEAKRRARQMKFPSLQGQKSAASLVDPLSAPAFKKYNDEGDHRPAAPTRFYGTIIDPVSGFMSAGGDVYRNTGVSKVKTFIHVSDSPQDHTPQLRSSIRMDKAAPPELQRESVSAPGQPSYWNSRKTLDVSTRAKVGGWTSDKDPRLDQPSQGILQGKYQGPQDVDKDIRDKLALQYMYKSSTQRQYEDIPWDNMLPPKPWTPTTTLEPRPDQVDQRYQIRRYNTTAQQYQLVGKSWDAFQTRNGYYKNPQWIDYTSPCPRANHIPLYGGCVGGDNLDELDNQHVAFKPYTVKRVNIPREAETSHRPNIPGYTGSTLYRTVRTADPVTMRTPSSEKSSTPKHETTTAAVHQPLPVPTGSPSEHKRDATMSKMVTLVPPCNPFNRIDSMPQRLKIN